MIHLDKLRTSADGNVHVSLKGRIEADFDGEAIRRALKGHKVALHMGEVQVMTSVGVITFERFVDSLPPGTEVVLLHISSVVAAVLGLLPGLRAKVKVESARLPFLCRRCGEQRVQSIPYFHGAESDHAPLSECGARMELDGLAEQYLPMGVG